ncbi:hypothetical protein HUG17_7304 [Dermatophagoides farinae]|uniref:Uncharacterized protein n=1 Tax=Dermatophagoides farinae TaxID=6954 RepID=A0A9D4NRY4_DERFA|nr:hypothetical protein HUG17_7304 [Dermatophagoides farinae]
MDLNQVQQNVNSNDDDDDDDEIDIYADLNFNYEQTKFEKKSYEEDSDQLFDELQVYGKLYRLETEITRLTKENATLSKDNETLRKQISIKDGQLKVLKNNISSLYKTAKLELDRRLSEKQELQNQYDAFVFRKIKNFEIQRQLQQQNIHSIPDNMVTPDSVDRDEKLRQNNKRKKSFHNDKNVSINNGHGYKWKRSPSNR